jgi:hypothetical protein
MSVHVLAVMDDAADTLDDKGRGRLATDLWTAKAAVAELLEAAQDVNNGMCAMSVVETRLLVRLRKAIDRVQGGA